MSYSQVIAGGRFGRTPSHALFRSPLMACLSHGAGSCACVFRRLEAVDVSEMMCVCCARRTLKSEDVSIKSQQSYIVLCAPVMATFVTISAGLVVFYTKFHLMSCMLIRVSDPTQLDSNNPEVRSGRTSKPISPKPFMFNLPNPPSNSQELLHQLHQAETRPNSPSF